MMMMPMDRYSGTTMSSQQQTSTAANTISAAELHQRHLMAGMSEREAAHAVAISSAAILDDEGDNNSTSGGDGGGGGGLGGMGGGHGGGGDDDEEAEGVWAPDIEAAFQEAIQIYLPCGRRKIVLHDEGKMYGRNELIARYIKMRVGKTRTRKQVSSHIQVLARKKTRELHSKIKDPSQRDKQLHRWSTMSSAQIVSAPFFSSPSSANGGVGSEATTAAVAAAAAAAAAAMMPQHHHSHHNNHHNHHNHHHAAFAAAMQQAQQQHHPQQQQQQQASSHLWSQSNQQSNNLYQNHQQQHQPQQQQQQHAAAVAAATAAAAAAAAHQLANNNNNNTSNGTGSWENALLLSSSSGSCIASQRLRMANFWAYVECSLAAAASAAEKQKLQQPIEEADSDSDATCHTFMHIGGGSSNKVDSNNVGNTSTDSLLETVHIKEIYDKFPDKKHGLKDLYEKGPAVAFFLVKCWADLNFNDMLAANGGSGSGGSTTFFGHNAEFESSEQMEITCSTKLCSFGKMMVEKVENECARFEDGRYVYRFSRSPMCEYMINLITKLKQVSDVNTMNTILENFTILQVVSNRATGETLLCIAFVFEVLGADEHEPQYHVYRLVDEDVDDKTALYSGANNNTTGVYS